MHVLFSSTGELFFASGEVAVKPRQATPSARLLVIGNGEYDSGRQHVKNAKGSGPAQGEDIESLQRRLKEAEASRVSTEAELARLSRDGGQARFDLEDAQAGYAAAQAQV